MVEDAGRTAGRSSRRSEPANSRDYSPLQTERRQRDGVNFQRRGSASQSPGGLQTIIGSRPPKETRGRGGPEIPAPPCRSLFLFRDDQTSDARYVVLVRDSNSGQPR